MSTTHLKFPPLDLTIDEPFYLDTISLSTPLDRASSSISMHTFGSQPSLRSSLRSSTRSSERSSIRSSKPVRFSDTQDRRIIFPEDHTPTEALPQAHLPIDGTLVRGNSRFIIPSIRLPLQDVSNKQPTVVAVEASTADFKAWLAKMGTPQTRPTLAQQPESRDSDRLSELSKTKSNRST
ncbi:hypothetical protein LTR95_019401, partial [Oleoguttula sp. CCFEE 5521]